MIFENAMNSAESLRDCHCLPNCEEVHFEAQTIITQLNPDELCDRHSGWDTVEMAMNDWLRTNSPLSYWHRAINEFNFYKRSATDVFSDHFLNAQHVNISFGLPTGEALDVCKLRYKYDIAKLTIQIMEPKVMVVKKDVKTTFADQLGVIGI